MELHDVVRRDQSTLPEESSPGATQGTVTSEPPNSRNPATPAQLAMCSNCQVCSANDQLKVWKYMGCGCERHFFSFCFHNCQSTSCPISLVGQNTSQSTLDSQVGTKVLIVSAALPTPVGRDAPSIESKAYQPPLQYIAEEDAEGYAKQRQQREAWTPPRGVQSPWDTPIKTVRFQDIYPGKTTWVEVDVVGGGDWIGQDVDNSAAWDQCPGPVEGTSKVRRVQVYLPPDEFQQSLFPGTILGYPRKGTDDEIKTSSILLQARNGINESTKVWQAKQRAARQKESASTTTKQRTLTQQQIDAASAERERLEPTDGPRTIDDAFSNPDYEDPNSPWYKERLKKKLMEERSTKDGHLPEAWFKILVDVVLEYRETLWLEGAPPGLLKGFVFGLELKPGAKLPDAVQPTKLSPGGIEKGRHHLREGLRKGHLYFPTGSDVGPTSARVRTLSKAGDEKLPVAEQWGRLVVDYRPPNVATVEEPAVAEDADHLTRWLSGKLWRTSADLFWGFNHLILTKRAASWM